MVTIKDVAREAGVAISTVSNVLNNVDVVKPETRKKVLKTVEKLNYTPNLNGKYLKKSETRMFGLFITSLEGPFYSDLISSMYSQCCKNNYNLTIFLNSEKNFMDSYQAILGKRVDGAIILNSTIKEVHIETFKKLKMPVVFLDREVAAETIASVVMDNYNGIKKATEYLVQIGHKRIGFVHGEKENYDEKTRYDGYLDALRENNIDVNKEWEINGDFAQGNAYKAVSEFLKKKSKLPQAFVCANDDMAIGTIEALNDLGIRVPEDISIVGFDNIDKTNYFRPAITTVDASIKELGKMAVERLINILQKDKIERICKMGSKLMIRESCSNRLNN